MNEQLERFMYHSAVYTEEQHKLMKKYLFEEVKADVVKELPKNNLLRYGQKIYSQQEEDGMIFEIFRRIGTTNKVFVEIGVEVGLECNTRALLLCGWKGAWIEGNPQYVEKMKNELPKLITSKRLQIIQALVDDKNITSCISDHLPEGEKTADLFSIDIDGNDCFLVPYAKHINPRVIIIEYNSKFPPPIRCSIPYSPTHQWDGSDFMGASLLYINDVMDNMGYALVGCDLSGTNAFYVRNDLLGSHFDQPGNVEYHYQPPRYHIAMIPSGHPASAKIQDFVVYEPTPKSR